MKCISLLLHIPLFTWVRAQPRPWVTRRGSLRQRTARYHPRRSAAAAPAAPNHRVLGSSAAGVERWRPPPGLPRRGSFIDTALRLPGAVVVSAKREGGGAIFEKNPSETTDCCSSRAAFRPFSCSETSAFFSCRCSRPSHVLQRHQREPHPWRRADIPGDVAGRVRCCAALGCVVVSPRRGPTAAAAASDHRPDRASCLPGCSCPRHSTPAASAPQHWAGGSLCLLGTAASRGLTARAASLRTQELGGGPRGS